MTLHRIIFLLAIIAHASALDMALVFPAGLPNGGRKEALREQIQAVVIEQGGELMIILPMERDPAQRGDRPAVEYHFRANDVDLARLRARFAILIPEKHEWRLATPGEAARLADASAP